jgi:HEAT repeat protein
VRNEATWALGLIGGPRASARAQEMAQDPSPQVRLAAVCSLEMIHDTSDPRIRLTLSRLSGDTDTTVREVARWAAGRFE